MRHMKSGRRLGRNSTHRKAMYRNMVTSLMIHGRIKTTEAKAKELRRIADRVITMGKKVPLSALEACEADSPEFKKLRAARIHNIRRARKHVLDADALNRVFNEYAERYAERPGGYTRIYKLGNRSGDNAPMALIELVVDHPAAEIDDGITEPEEISSVISEPAGASEE